MAGENLVRVLQIAGAALGIPAAAAGTFAAYQNYISNDVTCQKLRSNIVAIMERSVAPETKRKDDTKATKEDSKASKAAAAAASAAANDDGAKACVQKPLDLNAPLV